MNISGHHSHKEYYYLDQRRLSGRFRPECNSTMIRAIVLDQPDSIRTSILPYYTILETAGSEHHNGTEIMKLPRWLSRLTYLTDVDLKYMYRASGAALYHPKLTSM